MTTEQKLKVLESKLRDSGISEELIMPNAVKLLRVCELHNKSVNDIEIITK